MFCNKCKYYELERTEEPCVNCSFENVIDALPSNFEFIEPIKYCSICGKKLMVKYNLLKKEEKDD